MRPVAVVFAAALVLVAACGGKVTGGADPGGNADGNGSSGGSSGGGPSGNTCFESSGSSAACVSCVESQCASELASVVSGCSDLLACECPDGVYSASSAPACAPKAEEASCGGPAAQLGSCVEQRCPSQCATDSTGVGTSSGGSGSSGSGGGPTSPACAVDATVDCTGGATGFSCVADTDLSTELPDVSCSVPVVSATGEEQLCCFSGGSWSMTTCEPDERPTSVCPDPTSYAYQCVSGSDPTTLDALLDCTAPLPDPDGVHDDYCCTYG